MQTVVERRWYERPRNMFWVGFAVRILCIVIGHTYRITPRDDHWWFGYEAGRLARNLATGHGFSSPFNAPSGPSAWLGPLFPCMLALSFKMFGVYTKTAAFFIMVVDSVFSALAAPAVYEIGKRCFDAYGLVRRASTKATPVALWAGWLWTLHPEVIQYPIHWVWEMSLSTCLFAWALVLALRLRGIGEPEGHRPGIESQGWLWTGFGLLWGLEALSNATLLICLAPVTLWVLWPKLFHDRRGLGHAVGGALLSFVLVGVVLTPWIVRNQRVMHAFIPTRSNFGIEFWNATQWYHGAMPWGTAVPLDSRDPEFKLFAQMGEVKYAKLRMEQAKANIRANPREYLKDTALRTQFFWFIWQHPIDEKPVGEVLRLFNYGFISVCGLLGLALALKRRVPGAWMMFWVMMLVPIPYYLVTIQARFRYPIEPLICVLAVYLFRATGKRPAA